MCCAILGMDRPAGQQVSLIDVLRYRLRTLPKELCMIDVHSLIPRIAPHPFLSTVQQPSAPPHVMRSQYFFFADAYRTATRWSSRVPGTPDDQQVRCAKIPPAHLAQGSIADDRKGRPSSRSHGTRLRNISRRVLRFFGVFQVRKCRLVHRVFTPNISVFRVAWYYATTHQTCSEYP